MESVEIADGEISAVLARRGAELTNLIHLGRETLWQGDPVWWNFRAPILFPVIGRSPDNMVRIGGQPHPMPPHGFARDRDFEVISHEASRVVFELQDDTATRTHYPFAFGLRIEVIAKAAALSISTTVTNRGDEPMPFCLGYHPGFLWPQPQEARGQYVCRFSHREIGNIRRSDIATGLLLADSFPSPVAGRTLHLADRLFDPGALQFESLSSRRVWFGPAGRSGIDISFPDSPQLGIWTKPGAPFLCIEPWQGLAERVGTNGELTHRPGAVLLAPKATALYRLMVEFGIADPGDL